MGGQGLLFVPGGSLLNKANQHNICSFVHVQIEVLGSNGLSLKSSGTFRHRARVRGNRGNWQLHGSYSGLGPKPPVSQLLKGAGRRRALQQTAESPDEVKASFIHENAIVIVRLPEKSY